MDLGSASGGTPNPLNTISGHGCINMISVKNVVTHSKYYGTLQPDLRKKLAPPESPLHIEKPSDKLEAPPCILKVVLKSS